MKTCAPVADRAYGRGPLAQKLGLSVCAEGVDSGRTLDFLGRIGCHKAQGNCISRPLHARMLENRLDEWNVRAGACQARRPAHTDVRRPALDAGRGNRSSQ